MRRVCVADHLPDVPDPQARIGQEPLGRFHALAVQDIIKTLLRKTVQQLRQMPLRYVAGIRHLLQGQLLGIVCLHIGHCLFDQEAAGPAVFRILILRVRSASLQVFRHGAQRFVYLIHFGRLQQEAGDSQPDCLLCIAEVTVSGQNRHLHVRKLRPQSGQHGQTVLPRHADIREQNIRPDLPDDSGAADGIFRGRRDLTAEVFPADDTAQALHDQRFVIDQHHTVHAFHLPRPS